MKRTISVALSLAFLLFFASSAAANGMVLTVQPGAWVERGGQAIALAVKSEVRAGDTVYTNATGRVQVIFSDNTTISLGGDTRVAVDDFIFGAPGKKPAFSANMAKGAARFVTGKIVEQNREGFTITTPQATVGIRGTTFAVNVSPKGVTTVIGLSVNSAFPIAVTNTKTGATATITTSGTAVDASPSGNTSYQAPAGQFSKTGSTVNGQPAVAVAAASTGSGETAAPGANMPQGATEQATPSGAAPSGAMPSDATATAETAPPAVITTADAGGQDLATPQGATPVTGGGALATPGASAPSGGGLYSSGESSAARDLANSAGKEPDLILADLGQQPSVIAPDHSGATAVYTGSMRDGFGLTSVGSFGFKMNVGAGTSSIHDGYMNFNGGILGNGVKAEQNGLTSSGSGYTINFGVTDPGTSGLGLGAPGSMTGSISGDGSSTSGNWNYNGTTIMGGGGYSGNRE